MSLLKNLSNLFESSPVEIRRLKKDTWTGHRHFDFKYLEFGKLYKINYSTIYCNGTEYMIAFNTPALELKYGKDYHSDPFNSLISFSFDIKWIPTYEHFYYTHISVYENVIILYANKKDYDFYISKKIPKNIAYP